MEKKFYYEGREFYINGKPIKLYSGAIHYFRVPKEYWYDRLLKLKECGFNCVETYMAWNLHEPEEGQFDFSGNLDMGEFLDMAQDLGLYAIVRPGPYICAEWEAGGFPYWLLNYENLKIRTNNQLYFNKVEKYITQVMKYIKPRLIENGGNVLMVQIENEYGSFGNDNEYMAKNAELYQRHIPESILFTSDGAYESCLKGGTLPNVLATGNFGSDVETHMGNLERYRPNQPYMCMEFWCGWFDYWGGEHHERSAADKANCVKAFLEKGYSFNIYMFHGGTNFGFMNGANSMDDGSFQPTTTSYDYDALLSEAGDRTESYYEVREMMSQYVENMPPLTAKESVKQAYGKVEFTACALLTDQLGNIAKMYSSETPMNFEACNQAYGYMYYETELGHADHLFLSNLRDRAVVMQDGKIVETFFRHEGTVFSFEASSGKLGVLVENMGRINYCSRMFDKKGLGTLAGAKGAIKGWKNYSLPMNNLEKLVYSEIPSALPNMPAFYKSVFTIDTPNDTFLKLSNFGNGFATINGFNLGRYYKMGPTKTLYVPATLLKNGKNELVVFASDGVEGLSAEFVDTPIL